MRGRYRWPAPRRRLVVGQARVGRRRPFRSGGGGPPLAARRRAKGASGSCVGLPQGANAPKHGLEVVGRGCPAQVGEGVFQAGQTVGEEAGVGVGIEPADAAEVIEAGADGVCCSAAGALSPVADADEACFLQWEPAINFRESYFLFFAN